RERPFRFARLDVEGIEAGFRDEFRIRRYDWIVDRRDEVVPVRCDAPVDAAKRGALADALAPEQFASLRIERPDMAGLLAGENDILAALALHDDRAGAEVIVAPVPAEEHG